MRRHVAAALLALVALAAVAGPAAAKEANLTMMPPPGGMGPGDPWVATIRAEAEPPELLAEISPVVTLVNRATGERRVVHARRTGDPGIFNARIVFPTAGTWNLTLGDGLSEREYVFRPITVGTAPAAPPAGDGDGPFAPVWVFLAALAGLLTAAGAGLVIHRRGRAAPSAPAG
jgi:hypothetical protein